ncbi:MAG: DUF2079 domain-containing protein [Bacteroidales bacterium]
MFLGIISSDKNKFSRHKSLLWGVLIMFGVIYTAIVVSNHYFFRTFALDYGLYNQSFWDFAHFNIGKNTVQQPVLGNFFQIHPDFTLMVISPLYWIMGWLFGTYTLLIIQNIFILIGGYSTFLLVKNKTNDFWISFLSLIHYFFIWGHFSALTSDYNDTTVAATVVPLFLYFFDKRKYVFSTLCFLFIIIAKEHMPIWFIFISLSLILIYWKDKKRMYVSFAYIGVSLVYLFFLFKIFIPGNESEEFPYVGFSYSALGNSPVDVILFIINHPIKTFELLFVNQSGDPTFNGIKAEFYYVFLISGGIILFFNPKYFIMFIPVIAQKVLNDGYIRWGIYSFYSIEIVSILSLSVFIIISQFRNIRITRITGIFICVITIFTTSYLFNKNHRKLPWYEPIKENFYDTKMFHADFDVKKVYSALKKIPSDASVCATETVVPHLAFRKNISIFPYVRDAEFIFILLDNSTYPLTKEGFDRNLNEYLLDEKWGVILDDYPILILKKDSSLHKKNPLMRKAILKNIICNADSVDESKDYFYSSDVNQLFIEAKNQSREKSFSGKYSVKLTPGNPYGFTTVLKNVKIGSKFNISVWRYSEKNEGLIVASGKSTDDFYCTNDLKSIKSQDGWNLIVLNFTVTCNLPDEQLKLYVWNQGKNIVYFDDFLIQQLR